MGLRASRVPDALRRAASRAHVERLEHGTEVNSGWPPRRGGALPTRLRPPHRQPPPPAHALQPLPTAGVLHVRTDQHHPRNPRTAEPGLLPQEARRGLQTRPGRDCPGPPPTSQRPVVPPARQPGLHPRNAHRASGLTPSPRLLGNEAEGAMFILEAPGQPGLRPRGPNSDQSFGSPAPRPSSSGLTFGSRGWVRVTFPTRSAIATRRPGATPAPTHAVHHTGRKFDGDAGRAGTRPGGEPPSPEPAMLLRAAKALRVIVTQIVQNRPVPGGGFKERRETVVSGPSRLDRQFDGPSSPRVRTRPESADPCACLCGPGRRRCGPG